MRPAINTICRTVLTGTPVTPRIECSSIVFLRVILYSHSRGVIMPRTVIRTVALSCLLSLSWPLFPEAAETERTPPQRRQNISIQDAVLQSLEHNLDITISRQTKESRLTDIVFEQAKFDPTLSLNAQYNRLVSPLNRPILGFTGAVLQDITKFDQNSTQV